jgi:adenosine kinase
MAAILGMGNPILDISAAVDMAVVDKYGLKMGDAILAEEKHAPLFPELSAMGNVQYIAGGATQNTIRVAQWLLGQPESTAYMGCIGKDEFGAKLQAACTKDGVKLAYMIDEKTPTGTCATLINNKERSLCTDLKAANNFNESHLAIPANAAILSAAKVIYSAGYFATVSPASMKIAREKAIETGALYCLNLSAPFLMQVPPFKAVLVESLPFTDFLFCNETEAATWAETEGWDTTDVTFIATRLSLIPSAKQRKRTVVITQGADPTCVAVNGMTTLHPIIALPKEKLVDTNGAGDSYVGGFLAALAKGKDIAACCQAGAYAASVIVQNDGCTYPAKPDYSL